MIEDRATPVDQSTRDRVSTVFDTSFAVEAGAGTGKTTVLVRRILNLVRQGTRLRNICAITFTDRAAAELRLRIRDRIEAELAGKAEPTGVWEQALIDVENATISTIHSFAARLLRERPIEAGVSPVFVQNDAVEAQLFWDECWDQWLAEELNHDPFPPALPRALRLGLRLSQLRDIALKLSRHRDAVRNSPAPCAKWVDVLAFKTEFCADARTLMQLAASNCTNPGADQGYQHISELAEQAARLETLGDDEAVEFLNYRVAVRAKGNQRNWQNGDDCKRQKTLCRDLEERRQAFLQAVKTSLVSQLLGWLQGFLEVYAERKQQQGVLDFDDLLLLARDLLVAHPNVRRDFRRQYEYLLVDEFQDTDPLQAEMVFLLSDGRPDIKDWTDTKPDPGRLFIVGDPKQSIYRFRRADIELYERARQRIIQNGESPHLVQNFRSVPDIIEWVNHVFARLIHEPEDGQYQPPYVPLSAFRETHAGAGVTMLYPPESLDLEGLPTSQVRAWEAAYLACLIHDRIENECWFVFDRADEKLRPARYGDIGVLFPRTTDREVYEEAFARHQVPYRVEGGRQFFRTQEVQSLSNVVRAIDHPHDEVAVVAALRSRFFGCSDEDLLRWVQSGGRFHLLQSNPQPEGETRGSVDDLSPVRDSLALLRELHEVRSGVPPHRLLERLFEETRIIESTLLVPHGEQAAANLVKLLDRARTFSLDGQKTFGWFVRWLREMRQEEVEEEESPISEHDEQVVQLLTVHKAKGLEFPITVLANLSAGSGNQGIPLIVDRQSGNYEVSVGNRDNGFQTPGYDVALEGEKKRLDAELRRLFYVAATRARDHLVIPFFYRKPQFMGPFQKQLIEAGLPATQADYDQAVERDGQNVGPPSLPPMHVVRAETLNPVLVDPPALRLDLENLERVAARDGRMVESQAAERESWARARKAILERGSHGLDIATPSGAVKWEEDPDRREQRIDDGHGGAAFGSAFHALMERLDLPTTVRDHAAGCDIAELSALTGAVAHDFGVDIRVGELERLCLGALELPFAVGAADRGPSVSWTCELPISVMIDDILVEGKIDLLIRDGENLVVVDYKTDQVFGTEALDARAQHYRPQAAIYALMLTEALRQPVSEIIFAFVRAGEERHIAVDQDLLDEARQHLHRMVPAVQSF